MENKEAITIEERPSTKVLMVAFNSREAVCLSLHNIFKNVNFLKNEIIVCDNSTEFQTTDILRELGKKGYITYLDGVQNKEKRGSVNHRNGLLKCLERCKDDDRVLILDCDAFPVSDIGSMMLKVDGRERLVGAIHPRGYVHPSVLAGCAGKIRGILMRENEMIASGEKEHIDVFESYVIDENLTELKENIVCDEVEWICQKYKIPGMMHSYSCGTSEFYHLWYFSRSNGYKTPVDGISREDLAIIRKKYKESFVMDVSVIIPTYGIDDKNFDALDMVVRTMKEQETSYRYDIWIALYDQGDLAISIERDNFRGCNVHKIFDMEKWSRAVAFNRAFISLPYAAKYVFHDRDILVPSNFVQSVGDCPYGYSINYATMLHDNDVVLRDSVGGSNSITWDCMVMSGGMCNRMDGWGGEDREFDYRVSMSMNGFRTGKRLPLAMTHQFHGSERTKPPKNQLIMTENMRMSKDTLKTRCNYLLQDYRNYWGVRS